ncbi:hypothetical protein [Maritalea porphyrae]|uniref:hypothetical protein n=1 Tax=Maritalea porphyrae TaxID=880732 RepID=UPI0022AFDBD3|nr:hypothetical protein [Maritalea porphyrae]MCZ4270741.1 hypothetical protein [Maritalea porphyrae]
MNKFNMDTLASEINDRMIEEFCDICESYGIVLPSEQNDALTIELSLATSLFVEIAKRTISRGEAQ